MTPPPDAPHLFETIGFDGAAWRFAAEHRARMARSAAALRRRFSAAAFDAALASVTPAADSVTDPVGTRLARLTLAADGTVTAAARPLAPLAEPVRVVLTPVVVDPSDRWLHHKTTRRAPYDAALAHARAVGADDGVIVNTHGRVTETSRMTLFADLGDSGPLATPPLADGVLPGILRAHLLATAAAAERPLTPDDLRLAPRLFVGNAARGQHRAVWVETVLTRPGA